MSMRQKMFAMAASKIGDAVAEGGSTRARRLAKRAAITLGVGAAAGTALGIAAGLGTAYVGYRLLRSRLAVDLQGKVVLITGGSRGLGLAMAREFAAHGARLAICARDGEE